VPVAFGQLVRRWALAGDERYRRGGVVSQLLDLVLKALKDDCFAQANAFSVLAIPFLAPTGHILWVTVVFPRRSQLRIKPLISSGTGSGKSPAKISSIQNTSANSSADPDSGIATVAFSSAENIGGRTSPALFLKL
jgi:hypothetical protein